MRGTKPAWGAALLLWVGGVTAFAGPAKADQATTEFLAPFLRTRDFARETVTLLRGQGPEESRASPGGGVRPLWYRSTPNIPQPQLPSSRPAGLARFEKHIKDAARRFRVDPHLIKAIILTESKGDPLAVSPKNARGLMQVLPSTGRELGVRQADELFQPRTNIFIGTQYLALLLAQSNGNVSQALAAYNAGPGAHAERPLPMETRVYVPRVLRVWAELRASGSKIPQGPGSGTGQSRRQELRRSRA